MRVTILYLAAGNSRRFGENKLLYPLDGKAVYRHLLDRLAQIAGRHENWELLVVTQYERILEELAPLVKELQAIDPRIMLIAAGGVNPQNAGAYAATGVDGLATTAPFSAKPLDMSVRMSAR